MAMELEQLEALALASSRGEALAQLIPGTEDYYFYHCLIHQQREQLDEVDSLLETWVKRHGETARVREIRDRQALLTYDRDHATTLEHIRRRLDLHFDHEREVEGASRDLPTRLDPALVAREAFRSDALAQHRNLDGFTDRALGWLAREELSMTQLRALLARMRRPSYPDLAALVARELGDKDSRGFGGLPVHRLLTCAQLDALAEKRPELRDEPTFVEVRLSRLQPGADVDIDADPAAMEAFLEELWSHVEGLTPAFNSLKVHVLYHRLDFDRRHGVYDRDRFEAYVKLPRQASWVASAHRKQHRHTLAELGQDYRAITGLSIVGDDTELVRDYLAHFFSDPGVDDHDAFRAFIDADFSRRVFAETKILAGGGDQERWYSLLDDPSYYQELKERVDIELALHNPRYVGAGDPLRLEVDIKNVPALVVKVFEINTLAYFVANGRDVDTSIDLDGLVANYEQVIEYQEPPLRRVRRTLEIDSFDDRCGTFVIELIGNGKSSRALIRKGGLRYVERRSAAGHVLTILDEDDRPVPEAVVWFGGREYRPNEGSVRIPYGSSSSATKILLRHEDVTSVAPFSLSAESYEFRAGAFVDREQLVAGASADVVVRAALTLNGAPVSLSLIQEPKLTISSRDRHDTSSSVTVPIELGSGREAVHTFKVPDGLLELSFRVSGKVRSVTGQRELDVADSMSMSLNQIDLTSEVAGMHLARAAEGHVLYVLGKSGEPREGMQVSLTLGHRDFRARRNLALQTDDRGRVELGALEEITDIEARSGGGRAQWTLPREGSRAPASLHITADSEAVLPYSGAETDPARVASLLERRGTGYARECPEALHIEDGALRLRGLAPGDYDLVLEDDGTLVRVRVSAARVEAGWALSPRRHLQLRPGVALRVSRIELGDEVITIEIGGANRSTRVHVFASRFVAPRDARAALDVVRAPEPAYRQVARSRSRYLSGRDIGDEYRYILERKRARTYAGTMLDRPGLLLNPWAIRTTSTGVDMAKEGVAYSAMAEEAPAFAAAGAAAPEPEPAAPGASSNLDFLPRGAFVALNLEPGDDGTVSIDRADLAGANLLRVVVADARSMVSRHLALPEATVEPKDLRLRNALDPDGHFVQRKEATCLLSGAELVIEDIRTAEVEAVETVGKAHGLLQTLSNDNTMRDFEFVTRWPSLSPDEQREQYSKHACHELHLFLSRKDEPFFQEVVAPYLEHKRDKTFLDHYLIGADLRRYLEPWAYGRLNALERILLSRRVDGEEGPGRRHIKDRFDLVPPDVDRDNAAFDTALEGSALDTKDGLGMEKALEGRLFASIHESAGYGAPPPPQAPPAAAPKPAPRGARRRAKKKRAEPPAKAEVALDMLMDMEEEADFDDVAARDEVRRFYRPTDKTQEWAENNYYRRRITEQDASLIEVNAFWRDFADHSGDGPFLSGNFVHATSSFAEMMCALAVLDLPFEASGPESRFEGAQMILTARAPVILFHKQIAAAEPAERRIGVLVSQNYFRADDRYRYEDNERHDKYVTGELLVHTVYTCQVVLTNPSSSSHKLELLLQIPRGALPVAKGFQTRDLHVHLQPHGTHSIEYSFYFPEPGSYTHFPVHVSKNEALVAFAEPTSLEVVTRLSRVDTESWSYLSQHGEGSEVLRYLEANNIDRLDLGRIAWRMRDRSFYESVLALLSRRHVYSDVLWSYAIHHDDKGAISVFLRHQEGFLRGCGKGIDSPLVRIEPVERRWYEHLEYAPLVNARAHQLGARRKILNTGLAAQYRAFLDALTYEAELADDHLAAAAYYTLLQDRVSEGLALLERVDPDRVTGQLQLDYLRAYAALLVTDVGRARELAAPHRSHAVDRWRKRFANLLAVIDEAEGAEAQVVDADDRDQEQARLAATQPAFDFTVEGSSITVSYRNLSECVVSYYRMDIELLFSRQPFMQDQSDRFSIIRPNRTDRLELPEGRAELTFELPPEYRSANTIIEIAGAGMRRTHANYAHDLSVRLIHQYGQIRVEERSGARPLPRAYVKVYARKHGGEVSFYKDGYTDVRGAFDYASLSTDELDSVERFAVLVMAGEQGALIREAEPPQR